MTSAHRGGSLSSMEEPPILLDGARVLEFAILNAGGRPGENFHALAAGIPLGPDAVSRLVVAENLIEEGVFLIHCDAEWGTVIGESYADAASARAAAQEAYRGTAIAWTPLRELSEQEMREVETTRAFLREITAEFPPG